MNQDEDTPDPYTLPDNDSHPATIAARLMKHTTHAHLEENEVTIGWLMRTVPKVKSWRVTLGSIHDTKTMAQGAFKDLFVMMLEHLLGHLPQYVIVLDAEFWQQADTTQREALVWHELAHARQANDKYGAPRFDKEGMPVYELVSHDIEAFNSEVERYGSWHDGIASFLASARDA